MYAAGHFATSLRTAGLRPSAVRTNSNAPDSARAGAGDGTVIKPPMPRRRILALCLGGIGDTVLAFAALRDLRRACPHDHIAALAMWRQSAELLEDLGVFDEVLQHNFQNDRLWRSLRYALQLRFAHYDVSLLAFPANRFEYNAMAWLLGAPRRCGHTYVRGGDFANLRFLLTDTIAQQLGRHVVDENRALVAHFTGQSSPDSADVRLGPLDPVYHADAERMLAHLPRPLVGLHPGSSLFKGLTTKRWPVERFGELCHRIQRVFGACPVVFGNPDEIDLKLDIQRLCPSIYFAHGPSIRHTAALMARCAAFVSNDSALAHLANAVDVPVVMICGPTDAHEVRPYSPRGRVLTSGIGCSPCFRVGRQPMKCVNAVERACLKAISVDEVLEAMADVMTSNGPVQSKLSDRICEKKMGQGKPQLSLPVLMAAI
jgi:lipopolysaccharide heptosyltransferase II